MTLTVLNVAYPFTELTPDPVGGAEQVLMHLDRALVETGHHSIVVAAQGSQVCGNLVPVQQNGTGRDGTISEQARRDTQNAVCRAIARVCEEEVVDVVHLHGSDFYAYLPPTPVPTLVTLHLPLAWYPPGSMQPDRPNIWFNPVSTAQASRKWPGLRLLEPIENGVRVEALSSQSVRKGKFALALGRICPEKRFHLAMDASASASIPLLLAGAVYRWPEHQRYFEEEIAPRLDADRRWIGRVGGDRKRRLLGAARCLVVPSRDETSSLVSMEALAAGTPVVAFRVGALPDIVDDGVTGYVVDDVQEMAEALQKVDRLDSEACRAVAKARFDVKRSTDAYVSLYSRIATREMVPCWS